LLYIINTHNLLYEHTIFELRPYVGMKLRRTLLHHSFISKSHTETISGKKGKKSRADATARFQPPGRSLSSTGAHAAIKWAQSRIIAQHGPLAPRTRPNQPGRCSPHRRLRLRDQGGALSPEAEAVHNPLTFYSAETAWILLAYRALSVTSVDSSRKRVALENTLYIDQRTGRWWPGCRKTTGPACSTRRSTRRTQIQRLFANR
jgi:hypothetical protein